MYLHHIWLKKAKKKSQNSLLLSFVTPGKMHPATECLTPTPPHKSEPCAVWLQLAERHTHFQVEHLELFPLLAPNKLLPRSDSCRSLPEGSRIEARALRTNPSWRRFACSVVTAASRETPSCSPNRREQVLRTSRDNSQHFSQRPGHG